MKKILLKIAFIALGCGGAMNVWAFTSPARNSPAFGNLPLYFEEASPARMNHPAQFIARGIDCGFLISPAEARVELQSTDAATRKTSLRTVRMQLVGAVAQAQIRGVEELPGKVNYLIGKNPADWRTGLATYARVQVAQLYPGVNLVYYGNQRRLEYDFTIAPGTKPDTIKIRFAGVDKISIGAQGELILAVGRNEILQLAPVIYQVIHGQHQAVSGGYQLVDAHTVAFTVGKYNHKLPLVIDPVLNFSTYFGGSGDDSARSIALDTNGFIYITGQTLSGQLGTSNAFQINFAGSGAMGTGDAFVAKFDNQGSNLIYFTYLGGSADDQANGIAVDGAGNAFVTGFTDSDDFPTSTNALYRSISGSPTPAGNFIDAFVAELNPGGSNLVYSTYLGGSGPDAGQGIALDSSNNIYVTGYTGSPDLPITSNAFQKNLGYTFSIYTTYLYANAFVAEISASGTNLIYSSYLGGTNLDLGEGIAVDNSNDVYVTGYTTSTNFPTINAFQENLNGSTTLTYDSDAFVAKFTPSCTNLVYSTLLGGTNGDVAYGVVADTNGDAYVVGGTASPDFPNTVTNVPNLYNGQNNNLVYGYGVTTNAFLAQITWNGTNAAIGYSTVFGGTNFGSDIGYGVTLDRYGNVYVVGSSSTTNFPAFNTPGLMGPTNAGYSDAFVTAFEPNISNVIYSGYLGGSDDDFGYGIAVDSSTNVYIAGQTASVDFPTFSPYQSSLKGGSDAFLAKIGWVNDAPVITTQPTNQAVAVGTSVSFVAAVTGTPPLTYQWQEQVTNLQGTNANLIWTNLVNGGNISGVTSNTLLISNTQVTNRGSYRLYVANTAGSTTSSNADLTVTNVLPVITVQPVSETIEVGAASVGGYISFSVTNSLGTLPESYQWVKDGTNLVNGGTNVSSRYQFHIYGATNDIGGTNAALYIVDPQADDEGTYWLIITNPAGVVVSSNATLTVTEAPIITKQSTNQTVGLGSTVTFPVTAVGTAPLSYQWQYNGTNLTDGPNISGSTNATLTLTNVQTSDDGNYVVVVTNSFGSVTSSPPVVLTVLTVPTFTGITMGTNGNVVFSGSGGTNGGGYIVYASTNLALPLNQWQAISVNGNQFGSQGQFSFTNMPPAGTPQRFYILELPPP